MQCRDEKKMCCDRVRVKRELEKKKKKKIRRTGAEDRALLL